jgi:hypothetical protein
MFSWTARGRSHRNTDEATPISDRDIARDLARVARAYRVAKRSQSRFRIRAYLKEVYRLYRRWERKGNLAGRVQTAASLADFDIRQGSHSLKTLIDLTSTEADPKQRSRWAAALRCAASRNVHPALLLDFVQRTGGVAALARLDASSRRWD